MFRILHRSDYRSAFVSKVDYQGGLENKESSSVKPALVTTCLQRPHLLFPLENGFSLEHVLKEPV